MSCQIAKKAFYSAGKVYADEELSQQIVDATSPYTNQDPTSLGEGLVLSADDSIPTFFQTDLNTNFIATIDALIEAFTISTPPTSAYEIELNTKLSAAKVILEQIKKTTP